MAGSLKATAHEMHVNRCVSDDMFGEGCVYNVIAMSRQADGGGGGDDKSMTI
jgi:hypothetical protein